MHSTPPSAAKPLNQVIDVAVYRYLLLAKRLWWLLFLAGAVGVFVQALITLQKPVSYSSTARMILSGQIALPESSSYREEVAGFYGTQVELMLSGGVRENAVKRVQAMRPDLTPSPVQITAGVTKGTSIFVLNALGTSAEYTQALLNAVMDEYLSYRRSQRSDLTETTVTSIGAEILKMYRELRESEETLLKYQESNNLVTLEEAGNDAAKFLAELKRKLAMQEQELKLLQMLDVDQTIDRSLPRGDTAGDAGAEDSGAMALAGPQADYLRARQQLQLLQADLVEKSRVMRPAHPAIVRLNEDIRRQENLIEIFRKQSVEQIASRKQAIELEMRNTNAQIEEWEQKALAASRGMAEFARIKSSVDRARAQLQRYEQTQRELTSNRNVDAEMVSIMERASVPSMIRPNLIQSLLMGLLVGLAAGCGVLLLIDRLDDRINSQSEFEARFAEYVIGHVPQEGRKSRVAMIKANDERHAFAEAFRNIRSSIYYMPIEGERPRSFLVTSATPAEGKSTISTNLSITFAVAGSKVLLVDADLRRGSLHDQFEIEVSPGFSDVLEKGTEWWATVQKTDQPNLDVIPRGKPIVNASEFFLNERFGNILAEMHKVYDYIIIDSPPVLAADDATSLAPKIDSVLFVMRLSQTLARQARRSLDLLYARQANVLGVVLNCTTPHMPEYRYYYQYRGYYHEEAAGKEKGSNPSSSS